MVSKVFAGAVQWTQGVYRNNLCCASMPRLHTESRICITENPVYLSEDKLTDQITVNMRVDGQENVYLAESWAYCMNLKSNQRK